MYKLKDFVTVEMLESVGFIIEQVGNEKTAWFYSRDDNENHLFIVLDDISYYPNSTIDTLYKCNIEECFNFIFEKGWVEEV